MKNIAIKCSYDELISVSEISPFQGDIKKRKPKQIERLISNIERDGFSFPFFVWVSQGKKWCIDGHGRLLALAEMRKRGYTIPSLPVVYIEATNEKEARKKLIEINNVNGKFNKEAFVSFVADFAETLDFETMSIPTLDFSGVANMFTVNIQETPMTPDTFMEDAFIEEIRTPEVVPVVEKVVETPVESIPPQEDPINAPEVNTKVIVCPHCDYTFTP
jgi:hypothetical protein